VVCHLKQPMLSEVRPNFARWLRQWFGSIGRARVDAWRTIPIELRELALAEGVALGRERAGFTCITEVEGRPAHDPAFVRSVWEGYVRFVEHGFGVGTYHRMTSKVLAGDQQDGRPADQLLVLPRLTVP